MTTRQAGWKTKADRLYEIRQKILTVYRMACPGSEEAEKWQKDRKRMPGPLQDMLDDMDKMFKVYVLEGIRELQKEMSVMCISTKYSTKDIIESLHIGVGLHEQTEKTEKQEVVEEEKGRYRPEILCDGPEKISVGQQTTLEQQDWSVAEVKAACETLRSKRTAESGAGADPDGVCPDGNLRDRLRQPHQRPGGHGGLVSRGDPDFEGPEETGGGDDERKFPGRTAVVQEACEREGGEGPARPVTVGGACCVEEKGLDIVADKDGEGVAKGLRGVGSEKIPRLKKEEAEKLELWDARWVG